MSKVKTQSSKDSLVECPFCRERVKAKKLADHAKLKHANDPKFSKKPVIIQTSLPEALVGVEVQNLDLARDLNQLVVDESGLLINPKSLQEEPRKSLDERLRTVSLPVYESKQSKAKYKKKSKKVNPEINPLVAGEQQYKSIDDVYREKIEWLKNVELLDRVTSGIEIANNPEKGEFVTCPICKSAVKSKKLGRHFAKTHRSFQLTNEQIFQLDNGDISGIGVKRNQDSKKFDFIQKQNQIDTQRVLRQSLEEETDPASLVKCPLCKHKTKYNVLFVHIQVSHPEVNPKIVMSKFNQACKNKNSSSKGKYEVELNDLVREYERLKQSHDESRDGGKYMGHMRREHGKFGSLPLYDDYSDESNSE